MLFIDRCQLASIDEEHASPNGSIAAREKFWHDASARLGRLYRLTDRDLDEIEACIAEKIGPKPLPEAVEVGNVRRQAARAAR